MNIVTNVMLPWSGRHLLESTAIMQGLSNKIAEYVSGLGPEDITAYTPTQAAACFLEWLLGDNFTGNDFEGNRDTLTSLLEQKE